TQIRFGDLREKFWRSSKYAVAAQCQSFHWHAIDQPVFFAKSFKRHHLEALGHRRSLHLAQKAQSRVKRRACEVGEMSFASDEFKPASMTISEATRKIFHTLKLTGSGSRLQVLVDTSLESELPISSLNLIDSCDSKQPRKQLLRL